MLVYDLPGFEVDRVLSKPYFRNVHHVVPTDDDTLMVVVSQFDAVVELDSDGEIRREWSVIDGDPWDDYDSTIDYRTASGDVLPEQRSHPNWVFRLDSEWWVTRFYQEDAVCLTASRPSMEIDLEKPHDGNVFGDRVYFTTVNGYVVACDAESGASREAHNLDDFSSYDAPLGWCRGLEVVEEDRIVVGFTRFRRTKSLQNISWLGEQLGIWAPLARWFYPVYLFMGNRPTRIAMYDVNTGRECWEVDLADYGLDLVYSIHSVPDEVDPTAVFDAGD